MKKHIIFLLMVLITIPSFSIDNQTINTTLDKVENVVTQTNQLVEKIDVNTQPVIAKVDKVTTQADSLIDDNAGLGNELYSDIKSFLVATAKSLNVAVSEVFDILVKQQIVKSIAYCIPWLLLLIFTITRWNGLSKYLKSEEYKRTESIETSYRGVGNLVLGVVGSIVLTIYSMHFLYPIRYNYIYISDKVKIFL
jgi:predicted PurR-regulated permease PerM